MRADEADRRRLNDLFVELCRIESPSGREADCGARVRAELEGLGLGVEVDDSGNPPTTFEFVIVDKGQEVFELSTRSGDVAIGRFKKR